ncbi:hypothetical protein C4552_00595 [Candidatus Parcubacteria bacterium]|nr:MAG: hypothetical protein C4552_00595 [Candidatus Parcubacteria bacterium]
MALDRKERFMHQSAAIIAILAALMAQPAEGYRASDQAGVELVEVHEQDLAGGTPIENICADLAKKSQLPPGFDATRCIGASYQQNFGSADAGAKAEAKNLKPGDLLFVPYVPRTQYDAAKAQEVRQPLMDRQRAFQDSAAKLRRENAALRRQLKETQTVGQKRAERLEQCVQRETERRKAAAKAP